MVSFDAILFGYARTSQLLAQYNAVAKLIDEGKEEITTKTACNKDTGRNGGCRSGPGGPGFALVEDIFNCSSHFTSNS